MISRKTWFQIIAVVALVPVGWLLGGMTSATETAATDLPAAEKLLDKQIEALGGKDAHLKLKNRITKAVFDMSAMGVKGPIEVIAAAPNLQFTKLELVGMGSHVEGCNGEVVWEKSMMTGPRVKEGAERTFGLLEADFHGDINWRERYEEVKTVGKAKVDGKDCYKIELKPKGDLKPRYVYLDAETHLPVKNESRIESAMGEVDVVITTEDFRKVDGILIPFKSKTSMMGGMQTFTILVESVKHNQDLPEDTFSLPEEIKALVSKEGS